MGIPTSSRSTRRLDSLRSLWYNRSLMSQILTSVVVEDISELYQEPGERGYRYDVIVSGLDEFFAQLDDNPEYGALNHRMREAEFVEAVGDVVDHGDAPDAGASYRGWIRTEREGDNGMVVFYALFPKERTPDGC